MRRLLMSSLAIASLTLGAAGAMAQSSSQSFPPPVPNASGSQVTAPSTYRNTATRDRQRSMMRQERMMGYHVGTTGSVKKHHTKKHHHTMSGH